jgi:DNA-binding MarR family transcriptional regulator
MWSIDVYTSMSPNAVPLPCACTSIRRVARVLARAYDSALSGSGLNITQLAVMRAILRHPREPLSRVADDLVMDRTSLYRALALLRKNRWVSLDRGSDERSRTASVTGEGRRVMAKADPAWAVAQTGVVDRFGEAKWAALVAELQRLADCAAEIPFNSTASGARP